MIFKSLFGGSAKRVPANLPAAHAFVDVMVGGRAGRSVSVESVEPREIVVREVVGRAGDPAVFVYSGERGKFRFATKILRSGDGTTTFATPVRVDQVGGAGPASGAQKRSSLRLDALVPGRWRFAPQGKGIGDFVRANIRDISRGGCSLILDRAIKEHSMLEVRLQLKTGAEDLEVIGEVMRHERIASSGKFSHGLRFRGVTPEQDHAILDFINRKQAELRNRGLA